MSAVALLAFGAAAVFLTYTERLIVARLEIVRAFEHRATDTAGELANLRAAEQAYVAAGQGVAFWIPQVATLKTTTSQSIAALRQSASASGARRALDEAAADVAEFDSVDKRAREYLSAGDRLMAADVVFSDGAELAASAAAEVKTARTEEAQAFDAYEARARRLQASALGGAALSGLVIILLLTPRSGAQTGIDSVSTMPAEADGSLSLLASPKQGGGVPMPGEGDAPARTAIPDLKRAALVCTDFARVTKLEDLTRVLAGMSEVMDASGIVVWLGNSAGADLRPILAHGYPPQALAQMHPVSRSADNATATAYRSGKFQIILAQPGRSGALVAPLLAPEGCVGALTAEMNAGSETSDSVQALGAIFAAQLASVLSPSAAATDESFETRSAAG